MIGSLRGQVLHQGTDTIILDVQGVGYELTVTGSIWARAPFKEPLSLFVHTDVKENSISLYGFSDLLEREVFLLLKKVKGIGSRIALAIISSIGPEGVLLGIGQQDVSALKRVSGVGNKTAERIIVELREQVAELLKDVVSTGDRAQSGGGKVIVGNFAAGAHSGSRAPQKSVPGGVEGDVILALEKLGFSGDRARQVVTLAIKEAESADPALRDDAGELLRLALGRL